MRKLLNALYGIGAGLLTGALILLVVALLFYGYHLAEEARDVRSRNWREEARNLGVEHGRNGVPAQANPYTDSLYRRLWLEGWLAGSSKKDGAP